MMLSPFMAPSLRFGGATSDRVNCGSATILDNISSVSAGLWVYQTSLTGNRNFISKYRGVTPEGWILEHSDTTGRINWIRERATTDQTATSADNTLVLNRWQFVGVIADPTNGVRLFHGFAGGAIAEVSYSSGPTTGTGAIITDAPRSVFIGNRDIATPIGSFQGLIGPVMLSWAELSVAELQAWSHEWWSNPRGCVGRWLCGKDGSSVVLDDSGNGNHGLVTGAVAMGTYLSALEVPQSRRSHVVRPRLRVS